MRTTVNIKRTTVNIKKWSIRFKNAAAATLFLFAYTISMTAPFISIAHAAGAANLDQCANGEITAPASCGMGWSNQSLNPQQSHYREADSVPFRALLSGLDTSTSHTLVFKWATTKSSEHAYDYLTTYNRTQAADPCYDVGDCGSPSTFPIPQDSQVTGANVSQAPGEFTIFGGTITSVSAYSYPDGMGFIGDKSASLEITFTTTVANPVLAWGGHIASRIDWGLDNSASAISGAPYHVSLVLLDGASTGSQDRSIQAAAIMPTPTMSTQVSTAEVNVGSSVTDLATLTGANNPLTGTVKFYVCGPSGLATKCPSGGSQVGSTVALTQDVLATKQVNASSSATSAPFIPQSAGVYCFRAEYTPGSGAPYSPQNHTNDTTECFTAIPPKGSITIIKVANPKNDRDFGFTANGTGLDTNFTLDDDQGAADSDATHDNQKTFSNLTPGGVFTFTENEADGWDLSNLSCTGGADVTTDLVARKVSISLGSGENVTCTFINTQRGQIIVDKVTTPSNSRESFTFNPSWSETDFNLTDTATPHKSGLLTPGTYNVSETVPAGWQTSATCDDGSDVTSIVVDPGEIVTCTFTNTELAKLTITKDAINNDLQDFQFTTSGLGGSFTLDDDSGITGASHAFVKEKTFDNLAPGQTYEVTETEIAGWKLNDLRCTGAATFDKVKRTISFTPTAGQTATCIFINVKLGTISGVKWNDQDGDGVWDAGEPTLDGWIINLVGTDDNKQTVDLSYVTGSGINGTTSAGTGAFDFGYLMPGTYELTETNQGNWTPTHAPTSGTFTLLPGQNLTNQNFGNFKNGSISGYKWNDLNGNSEWDKRAESGLAGWKIFLDKNDNKTFENGEVSTVTATDGSYSFGNLAPGTYSVCEVQQTGWVETHPGLNACYAVIINQSGEANPDTNFGNQGFGTLQIKKKVVSTEGFTDPGTFDLLLNGEVKANDVGNNGATEVMRVPADTYTVSERAGTSATNLANYESAWVCEMAAKGAGDSGTSTTVEVKPGDTWVCTFTNTRKMGNLKVVKVVENDYGDAATVDKFSYKLTNDAKTETVPFTEFGKTYTLPVGTDFNVVETAKMDGYELSTTVGCEGKITSATQTCTITNEAIQPELTVIKKVDNRNTTLEGVASDFTMKVDATDVTDASFPGTTEGTTVGLDVGEYEVSEESADFKVRDDPTDIDVDYLVTYSDDCKAEISLGQDKTCIVTNTAILKPKITIVKTASDKIAHEGKTVTYTFKVTNEGNTPLSDISITDTKIPTEDIKYVIGDDGDNVLEFGETWIYNADYVVPAGVTIVGNTVTATGVDDDETKVEDSDDHELKVIHPAFTVTKTGPAQARPGDTVTYMFTIKNTGDTLLDVTEVMDDIAGEAVYVSGDVNEDRYLNPGETWVASAKYVIPVNATSGSAIHNVVRVCAEDILEKEFCENADHTTKVFVPKVLGEVAPPPSTPQLLNTGLSLWSVIMMAFSAIGLALLVMRKGERR